MKVTVGVSGGIAAYKAAELVRALQRQALDVHVVMTEAAQRFITPLTFASLTGHKVITGLWPSSPGEGDLDSSIEHIGEAIIVGIEKAASPTNKVGLFIHARCLRKICEHGLPVIVVKIHHFIREVRLDDIEPAVVIVVRGTYAHARLLLAFSAEGHTPQRPIFTKGPVVIIHEQQAWR